MKPAENIEKLISKINVTPDAGKDRKTLDDILAAQERSKKKLPAGKRPHLVRLIMKNRMTKLTVAAAAIAAVCILMQIPGAAYALQDTIEAYNSIRWVHINVSDVFSHETRTSEAWLGCDEQGNVTKIRFQSDDVGDAIGGLTITGDSGQSQAWLPDHNLHLTGCGDVSILLSYDVSELDPGFLIKELREQESRGEVILDINEPTDKREPITVTVTYPQGSRSEDWKKVFYIDQATKLVIRIDKFERKDQEFQHVKTLEFFDYNQEIDQKMFTLAGEVPSGATAADMSEAEAGLAQGDMTDEQIATEVTREFFKALIAKDFVRAGRLYLAAPDFLVEKLVMGANVLKITSIEPGRPDPDPDSSTMLVSCKALAESGGQYFDLNAWEVRVSRVDEDANIWLISGTSISVSPARGFITVSPDRADPGATTYEGLDPDEYMKKWLVLGPLPYPVQQDIWFASEKGQQVAFDTDSIDFVDFTPKVTIDNVDYEWSSLESKYDIIDLNQLNEDKNDFQIAYLWAQIEMSEDRTATLGIGSDDGVKVWLNGELVHENWLYRGVVPDNDRLPVTFKKGPNQLVLKVQNALGPWGFCCRLLDE